MGVDVECLTRVWIEVFGEPPSIADPELMMQVLAELGPRPCTETGT